MPHCGSLIYSRRNILCGVCGRRLPPELLFSADERKAVEQDLAEAKQRARKARLGSHDTSSGSDSSSGIHPGIADGGDCF